MLERFLDPRTVRPEGYVFGVMRTVAFRVPPDLIADFERIAARDDRTVSQELRRLIRLAVEADTKSRSPTDDAPAHMEAAKGAEASVIAAARDRDAP